MVNRKTFANHLASLKTYLGYLKTLRKYKREQVIENWQIYGLIERYFQLSIEAALALGEQIISNEGFRTAQDYRDIIYVLAENKVVPKKFAEDIVAMAGLRNILVHGYTKIDRDKLYRFLHRDLVKIPKFASYMARFVRI